MLKQIACKRKIDRLILYEAEVRDASSLPNDSGLQIALEPLPAVNGKTSATLHIIDKVTISWSQLQHGGIRTDHPGEVALAHGLPEQFAPGVERKARLEVFITHL